MRNRQNWKGNFGQEIKKCLVTQPNPYQPRRDPTPKNILGVHWDMTKNGEILHYLAINRTENSTTLWNYRQRECAFWTEYLPSVIGYITPTYPPTTEVCMGKELNSVRPE